MKRFNRIREIIILTLLASLLPLSASACTRTPGYWGNHSAVSAGKRAEPWPINGAEYNSFCGESWYDILNSPMKGEPLKILARHYIAAALNYAENGVNYTTTTAQVDYALTIASKTLNAAQSQFLATEGYSYCSTTEREYIISLAAILSTYNEGLDLAADPEGSCSDYDYEVD